MTDADTYVINEDFTLDVIEDEEEENDVSPKEKRKLTEIEALIEDIKESVKKKIIKLPDVCPVPSCRYKSQKEESFLQHLDHHICTADVKESVENEEVKFLEKCPVPFCLYTTQNKEWFLSHMDHHSNEELWKQYKCRSCNFGTLYKNELRLHSARCNNCARTLYCSYEGCNFVTYNLKALRIHVSVKHVAVRGYACRLCRFKTQNIDAMLTHRNVVHPEVKQYMCKMCGFRSENRSELISHQKVHVRVKKVKIFKCVCCDYGSRYKRDVLLHHALKHSKHKVALNN